MLPGIVLGILYVAAFAIYAGLLQSNSLKIHEPRRFGDSAEYLRIARMPVFSARFWTQGKPPITSLIYKSLGRNPNRILAFQLWFTIVCWTVLALAVAHVVRSYYLKPIAFALVLAFSLSRDVFMWIPFIGSEAISFSITALFIAAAIWLIADWKGYKIPFLIVAGFLMAFSRDTLAYVLLIAVAMMLPFIWLSSHRRDILVMMGAFLAIFATSMITGSIGMRFEIVFPIITAMRIFPNPAYVAFFKSQGMPVDPSLVERSNPNWPGYAKWDVTIALWDDPKEEDYRQWMRTHGAVAYLKYLWFFKEDVLQRMFIEDGGRNVFYPDVYYYTATGYRPILKDLRLAELLYPTRFGLAYFFFANLAAAMAFGFAIMLKKKLWIVPIFLILATYPQAFLIWNGDANDIPRHSVGHNIMERLGMWILVLFVVDTLAQLLAPFVQQGWETLLRRLKTVRRGQVGRLSSKISSAFPAGDKKRLERLSNLQD
jgi:hypothetical protein